MGRALELGLALLARQPPGPLLATVRALVGALERALLAAGHPALRARRETVARNVERFLAPPPRRRARILAGYARHGAAKAAEDLLLLGAAPGRLLAFLRREGRLSGALESLDEALRDERRGLVLATGHVGALGLLAPLLLATAGPGCRGRPVYFTNKRGPESVTARLVDAQCARATRHLGAPFVEVAVDRGGSGALRVLLRALREERAIVLVGADGDLYGAGRRAPLRVPFLGAPIAAGAGAAWLAQASGAPLLPAFARRHPRGWELALAPPLPPCAGPGAVAARTVALFAWLEGVVRRHPAQWLFWDRLDRLAAPSPARAPVDLRSFSRHPGPSG